MNLLQFIIDKLSCSHFLFTPFTDFFLVAENKTAKSNIGYSNSNIGRNNRNSSYDNNTQESSKN